MDDEEWVDITYDGMSRYSVSNYGRVQNRHTGRMMSQLPNQFGVMRVGLMDSESGKQVTLSVTRLVAEHFVPGSSVPFNTPINIDGDRFNNSADNIAWRPRWFAVKFFNQFEDNDQALFQAPIRDEESGVVYANSREAAKQHGLLEANIVHCIVEGDRVFPTWQSFARV